MKIDQRWTVVRFVLPAALAIFVGMTVSAQRASGQTYTFTEWATPTAGSQPLHVVSASPTQFYFTESARNRVAGLNSVSNAITEWLLPPGSMPHGLVLDASGDIAFCGFSGDFVGLLNTTTSELIKYPVPTPNAGTIHLDTTISTAGTPIYFFSEALGNKIGMLDPTGAMQVTEWAIPTASSTPRGVSMGLASGQGYQVFFAELSGHKIGLLDTSTNNITEWPIPRTHTVEHLHFVPNASGVGGLVYFGDLANSYIGVLSPTGNTETLWTAPTVSAAVPDVFVIPGTDPIIYFSERNGSKIGVLDTQVAQGITLPLNVKKITVTPVAPNSSTITPANISLAKGAVTTIVTPTVTTPVTGVVTGGFAGFTEYSIPTSASGALGISGVGSPTIVFAEFSAGKIGTLTSQ